ncbi:mechanosensitive ion channel domain-containing protein [uncultured Ferrimonas sp.]|uniref:mechanosensitive ion channel family protein n=1 Tax=uncultured Ferrimonas sp. TaxID=432640 RepID=UPI002614ACCA|nr:mechanosensitive ion channel domain-containing protein [uncultured Ferrimonas sp.]
MSLQQQVSQWLAQTGVELSADGPYLALVLSLGLVALAWLSLWLARGAVGLMLAKLNAQLPLTWHSGLQRHRLLPKLARLVPMVLLSWGAPLLLAPWPTLLLVIDKLLHLWLLLLAVSLLFALLDTLFDALQANPLSRRLPLQSMVQLSKLFLVLISLILMLAALLDRSPLYLLSGLGVATGLLLLIFRDTILGFVAGIQLSINRMVSRGDWVQMDQFGADGEVLEVSLTTVKVQNWDKTITMIPAYAMVSNAFRNWRGMSESGGRRIKRALLLDQHSIDFVDPPTLARLSEINLLRPYLEQKQHSIASTNATLTNLQQPSNGRRLTNIGCLRAYLLAYLRQHPAIHQQQTLLVRQLDPRSEGLPLEIYCFSNDTRWEQFEAIQSDIFDHVFAILPQFGLRTMQQPTGADLRQWRGAITADLVQTGSEE